MSYRFLAFALMALLLGSGAAVALGGSAHAQADDLWYPGEGVKQDMFVTYRIQEYTSNDEKPFEMTLYFQEQDQDGDWIVPTYVVDDSGTVIQGTMKLSESMGFLAGTSDIPPEMNTYISGYSGSIHWLDSFTTKADPKSLATGTNWGRTGNIGGSDVKVNSQESVTVQAGTYDTSLLILHKGYDSKIWVLNEFPFPIKAEFYTDTTTGAPQVQFAFELLKTGMGKPEVPVSTEEVPTPPLTETTGRGEYKVTLDWEPASIEPGKPVIFTVSLTDNSGFPLENANYDFVLKNASGGVIQEFLNQPADAQFGTGTHEVQFDSAGGFMATVVVNSVSGRPAGGSGGFTESVDFSMVVVPEFPVSAAIVAAAVIGLVVLVTRARGTGMGSLFGSRGGL